MTPKEKARELVDKFLNLEYGIIDEYLPKPKEVAKQCALICVEECIKESTWWHDTSSYEEFTEFEAGVDKIVYWQQVKTEIEKL